MTLGNIRWGRGFFRIWVIFAVLWVGTGIVLAYDANLAPRPIQDIQLSFVPNGAAHVPESIYNCWRSAAPAFFPEANYRQEAKTLLDEKGINDFAATHGDRLRSEGCYDQQRKSMEQEAISKFRQKVIERVGLVFYRHLASWCLG